MGVLLAVDAGVRTGLALFDCFGHLLWCRSHNLGTTSRLKKAAARILFELPHLEWLIVEGGGSIADIWVQTAQKRGIMVRLVQAHEWRADFLLPRQQHSGSKAKAVACTLVRVLMDAEGPSTPTAPGHDAAEAVLIGLWAAVHLGWRTMPQMKV